jgi:hypothetical protein
VNRAEGIPLPPLPTGRACPVCAAPQRWCDSPACGAVLGVGHPADGTPATYSAKPGDGTLDLWNACRLGEMASVLGNLLAHLDATAGR